MTSRLFVSIWPDDAARAAIARTVESARAEAPEVRWQPAERWHVTLAFLGEADPERASRRIGVHMVRAQPTPDPIGVSGPGTFGPVIWLGIDHGPWLGELAAGLQQSLHVSDRRFRAHLTVGRVRGTGGAARAQQVAALLCPPRGIGWTPTEITLVESLTGPAPAYRVLERWPIAPSGRAPHLPTPTRDTPDPTVPDSTAPETPEEP